VRMFQGSDDVQYVLDIVIVVQLNRRYQHPVGTLSI
jgi:hypothetical protein